MNFEAALESLRKNLKQFGLNPADWLLQERKEDRLLLVNRHDANFTLLGLIKNDRDGLKWQELQVYSV